MHVLVANLGSTSFKYRLYDMEGERQLARGGIERIGAAESRCFAEIDGIRSERSAHVPDHAVAVRQCLDQLTDPETGCLRDAAQVSAIGFKAVHGGAVSGAQRVTPQLLEAMEAMASVAPAHNPPYTKAMRLLAEKLPDIPLVAAFETGFHATIPQRNRLYAVPWEWAERHHVKRWGFHGASHRYIATHMTELTGRHDLRIVSCHLGGSSSLCAIRSGESVWTSMGMSPQSGLPQNNRTGDFDPFALPWLIKETGCTLDELLADLAERSGLLGLSGSSGDVRDLETSAAAGDERAQLTLDLYTSQVRHALGAALVELGGADAVVFTGGIGENSVGVRSAVCRELSQLGIVLDEATNAKTRGEAQIQAPHSATALWVVPTNEE